MLVEVGSKVVVKEVKLDEKKSNIHNSKTTLYFFVGQVVRARDRPGPALSVHFVLAEA